MNDFRDDHCFKQGLIYSIAHNCSHNSRKREVLTSNKLALLYYILKNPICFKKVASTLLEKEISGYKATLYFCEVSLDFDAEITEAKKIIASMCRSRILDFNEVEGHFYISPSEHFVSDVLVDFPIITSNKKLLVTLAGKSEYQINNSILRTLI